LNRVTLLNPMDPFRPLGPPPARAGTDDGKPVRAGEWNCVTSMPAFYQFYC
jgi:hypothetical protein